jgi:hypothetical protein
MTASCTRAKALCAAVGLLAFGVQDPASAVLGDTAASVQADRARMNGTLRTVEKGRFAIHEIETAAGTSVREYVSPAGVVFAVTWAGPSLPDLRQLLGLHFETYTRAVKAQRAGRGPVSVREPGLVVQSGGQMRAFFGRAYVPSMIPPGVAADEIQ